MAKRVLSAGWIVRAKIHNTKLDLTEEMLTHKKGQEHFKRFTELIKIEPDETAMVEERWKKQEKQLVALD